MAFRALLTRPVSPDREVIPFMNASRLDEEVRAGAALNGKRYRGPWFDRALHRALKAERNTRGIVHETILPPHPMAWVQASDLELGWLAKKEWASYDRDAMYRDVARSVVDAWHSRATKQFRFANIYVEAWAAGVHSSLMRSLVA